jgi:hypothetical protein
MHQDGAEKYAITGIATGRQLLEQLFSGFQCPFKKIRTSLLFFFSESRPAAQPAGAGFMPVAR